MLTSHQHPISPLSSNVTPPFTAEGVHTHTTLHACMHRVSSSFLLLWYVSTCAYHAATTRPSVILHTEVKETVQFPELEPVFRDDSLLRGLDFPLSCVAGIRPSVPRGDNALANKH